MQLTYLRVKNFRSLQDVELKNLKQFNVLIGKNNAGKSAVFGALRFLADIVNAHGVFKWGDNITSHFSKGAPLEIWLEFKLSDAERNEVIKPLSLVFDDPSKFEALRTSSLCQKIRYHFKSEPLQPATLFPEIVQIFDENSKWVTIQKKTPSTNSDSCSFSYSNLSVAQRAFEAKKVEVADMIVTLKGADDVSKKALKPGWEARLETSIEQMGDDIRLNFNAQLPISWGREEFKNWELWPFVLIGRFLKNSFFFDHFRTFYPEQQVGGKGDLNQDGNNLVQVLNFWGNNHRRKFERIEKFVQAAFTGVGGLETPIRKESQQTQTAFRSDAAGEQIPLQHMGGGVAQLLMAVVALETTTPEFPIFLEEPETNLHPGAQRFLADKLCDEGRQVFITTHSPTFVNLPRAKSVHKVKMVAGKTNIVSLDDKTLHVALAEIGARNSDVLLSDAVVFVEGESDLQVLHEWCRASDIPLAGTNTSVLVMRSFGRPETALPLRSDTLKSIATSAGIPHMFLLDCDELSDATKRKIKKDLAERVHIFERRELENYLLIPRCIRQAIREKLLDGQKTTKLVEEAKDKDFERIMRTAADGLKNRILVKRVRSMLEPPPGGFYPRQLFEDFEKKAGRKELSDRLGKALKKRFEDHLKKLKLGDVANEVRKKFDKEWKNEGARLNIAPGTELLDAVFQHFGTEYSKETDARRIAKYMTKDDFNPEVVSLLAKIRILTQRESDSV